METLTRAELLEQIIFMRKNMNRADVEQIIDRFFYVITSRLEEGEVVRISGFGNFILLDKKERPGRNPKTGESIPVSSRRVVTFKAGNKLKAVVASYTRRDRSPNKSSRRVQKKVELHTTQEDLETV